MERRARVFAGQYRGSDLFLQPSLVGHNSERRDDSENAAKRYTAMLLQIALWLLIDFLPACVCRSRHFREDKRVHMVNN